MRSLAAVLLGVLLAGCTGSVPGPAVTEATPPQLPDPVTVEIGLEDCRANVAFFFAEFRAVEPFLPAGFHPRDSADLVGTDLATGQAGVVASVDECLASTVQEEPVRFMDVAILVEAPHVPGEREPSNFDGYLLERKLTAGALRDKTAGMGLPVTDASEIFVSPGSDARDPMRSEVRDAGGVAFELTGAAVADQSFDRGIVRFWHTDANGTAYLDQNLTLASRLGSGVCSYHASSRLADIFGQDGCPPDRTAFARFVDFDLPTRMTLLPGVHPA